MHRNFDTMTLRLLKMLFCLFRICFEIVTFLNQKSKFLSYFLLIFYVIFSKSTVMFSLIKKWSGVSLAPTTFQSNVFTTIGMIRKHITSYTLHPEMVKQSVKQRDAEILCKFFESDEYKRKVSEFIDLQNKILTSISPCAEVKYEHVLCCAQPKIKKPKPSSAPKETKKMKKKKTKGTVIKMLMDKREDQYPAFEPQGIMPVIMKQKYEKKQEGQRLTTTIVPLYLMKIKQHKGDMITEDQLRRDRSRIIEEINTDSLQKFNEYKQKQEQKAKVAQDEQKRLKQIQEQYRSYESRDQMQDIYEEELIEEAGRGSSGTNARTNMPGTVLSRGIKTLLNNQQPTEQKKSSTLTASSLPSRIPVKIQAVLKENPGKRLISDNVEEINSSKAIGTKSDRNAKKIKKKPNDRIDNLEGKNTIVAMRSKQIVKAKPKKPFVSLFHRVKSVTSKPKASPEDTNQNSANEILDDEPKALDLPAKPSETITYKLVSKSKCQTEATLRDRFKMQSAFWNDTVNLASRVKKQRQKQQQRKLEEIDKRLEYEKDAKKNEETCSIDTAEFQKAEEYSQKMGNILRNFRKFRKSGDKSAELKKSPTLDNIAGSHRS